MTVQERPINDRSWTLMNVHERLVCPRSRTLFLAHSRTLTYHTFRNRGKMSASFSNAPSVNETPQTYCSWTTIYTQFRNTKKMTASNAFFLPVYRITHQMCLVQEHIHTWCSWTCTYLMFMNIVLRSFMNMHFLPFCKRVTLWESTHLMFLYPGVIAVHEQALTWCSWTLF